ncbi:thioredoxin reductase/glutathione-related protein [Stenotrophomonas phage StenR_269]|nr:thioredoxin reductase/glutathione-related protein [Stenotrophomonas phage StenR_269]
MKLLCRIGWHDWKHWQEVGSKLIYRSIRGVDRVVGMVYDYTRTCKCCRQVEHRTNRIY